MSKSSSESFIYELPLKVTPEHDSELCTRLDVARQLYHGCLGECLKQISLMRQSKQWKQARLLPKKSPERKKLFQENKKQYGFSEYELHKFVGHLRNSCSFQYHIDSSTAQKIATKAFQVSEQYLLGKRGKPRFKGYGRLRCIEGKSNVTGIRFKGGCLCWNIKGGKSLNIPAIFDFQDKHGVESYALNCRTKYVRLVRKIIKGTRRWYVQLIQEGKPHQKAKNTIGNDVIGLDMGPSSIAVVASDGAFLTPFCSDLTPKQEHIKHLQRRIDRSKRATNPQNYASDGTLKKGPRQWNRSKRYQRLQHLVAEESRKLAETRKRLHGELVNHILKKGKIIQTEKLSYRAFQKIFGKSVGFRAPGMFLSMLSRKAESAGGKVEEFSTYQTKLSQTCHCGRGQKKALSERWHSCPCGVYAQRDLYSAFLARHVKNNTLDTHQAQVAWTAAEPLLERAVSRLEQSVNGKACLSSFGLNQRQNRSHAKERSPSVEAVDVVDACREPQRAGRFAFRTPWL